MEAHGPHQIHLCFVFQDTHPFFMLIQRDPPEKHHQSKILTFHLEVTRLTSGKI